MDMKIKLLKNHVLGKQGDVIKANYHRARYLIAMGVAIEQKQTKVKDEEITDKVNDDGSNTKKRVTRKGKERTDKIDNDGSNTKKRVTRKGKERTDKIDNNGSNTKKRATRKSKANAKP